MKNLVPKLAFLIMFYTCDYASLCFGQSKNNNQILDSVLNFDSKGRFIGEKKWTQFYDYTNKQKLLGFKVSKPKNSEVLTKVGHWQVLDFSNQKVYEGDYQVGITSTCCSNFVCSDFYSYRVGKWKYYYPNGQLKASGTYSVALESADAYCGKVNVVIQTMNNDWQVWDVNGAELQMTPEIKKEFEVIVP